jgi:hypothetical protein
MLVGCVIGLQRGRRAKNWRFETKKVKIAVLGNPDPDSVAYPLHSNSTPGLLTDILQHSNVHC